MVQSGGVQYVCEAIAADMQRRQLGQEGDGKELRPILNAVVFQAKDLNKWTDPRYACIYMKCSRK